MSITLDSTSYNSGAIEVGGVQRIILGADGGAELHQSPTQDSSPLHIATMEALWAYGGMPRFTPYVWGGRADAMPAGDTQSSGQQLLDLMYPDMRADVVATQFTCPENEWQADPYKRVTHWSLGDGVSWMRPPDKNCVQPGSLEGPFFAGGVGSGSPLLGTVVLDQMQGFKVKVPFAPSASDTATQTGGPQYTVSSGITPDATIASDGVNGAPRFGKFTRPRTWHGIWMIRMYGRVLNTGTLDAAGLNTRMDMLDARVAGLEGRKKSIGDGQSWKDMTAQRSLGVEFTNDTGRTIVVRIAMSARPNTREWLSIDGVHVSASIGFGSSSIIAELACEIPDGCTYSATGTLLQKWMELRA